MEDLRSGLFYLFTFTFKVMRRNLARVIFISICVSVAVISSVWIRAFLTGFGREIELAVVKTNTGHYQLQHPEFARTSDTNGLSEYTPDLEQKLQKSALGFSPELVLDANTHTPEGAQPFRLLGIVPELHHGVMPLKDHMVEGEFLNNDADGAVIGLELALFFKLKVGEQIVVNYQDEKGELRSEILSIKGVFHYNSRGFERKYVYVNQKTWQRLFFLNPPDKTLFNRIPMFRKNLAGRKNLEKRFADTGLVLKSWKQINPELGVVNEFQLAIINLFFVVVGITATMTILTPIQMSWQERFTELRTMNIMGLSFRDIWKIGSIEVIFMAILCGSTSILFLALILGVQSRTGVDFTAINNGEYIERAGIVMPRIIYPRLELLEICGTFIFVSIIFAISYAFSIRGVLVRLRSVS